MRERAKESKGERVREKERERKRGKQTRDEIKVERMCLCLRELNRQMEVETDERM